MPNQNNINRFLLFCGLLSSLLYIAVDVTASIRWNRVYDYFSQGFSELLAFGSPTRSFVLALSIVYNVLVIALGFCIASTAGQKRSLRITGFLLIGYAVVGIVTPSFFPAPMRGMEATVQNVMHLPLTALEVLLILSSVVTGAIANGTKFRVYSICSLAILTLFGIWGGSFVAAVAANQPTPWLGVIERVNIYGYLLWIAVLSVTLFQKTKRIIEH